MENKSLKTQNLTNEEEKIINWLQVQESFKKILETKFILAG